MLKCKDIELQDAVPDPVILQMQHAPMPAALAVQTLGSYLCCAWDKRCCLQVPTAMCNK